jgi:thiosulfate dehydrogenase
MKRRYIFLLLTIVVLAGIGLIYFHRFPHRGKYDSGKESLRDKTTGTEWVAPDSSLIPHSAEGALIRYGKDLITNTSLYFGPKGRVSRLANGMNCQNCHLDAGTRNFSNPFSGVSSLYPQFRPRSGRMESIEFKIHDCFERSMNGAGIDSSSLEMRSMVAYMKWVGKDVPKGTRPRGSGTEELAVMNRAADPAKGSLVYRSKCETCHGPNGQGQLNSDHTEYIYPPLWGEHSYNTGAGMFRLSKLAGFIKYSMPFGTRYPAAQLKDDEAWDVAAFIDSHSHPVKFFKNDWPDLKSKPYDYPFGPYADSFTEKQHKYGPFTRVQAALQKPAKKSGPDELAKKN